MNQDIAKGPPDPETTLRHEKGDDRFTKRTQ